MASSPSVDAFVRDRVVTGPTLVVPMMVVWREYLAYCDRFGFDRAPGAHLRLALERLDGVSLTTRPTGALRTLARGMGLTASASGRGEVAC